MFAKQGIEARIVLIKGAPTLVASLISGDIDIGYTGFTAVLGAASQGLYLRILSSISSKLTHSLVAAPQFKTAEQLRGKRFGIQSIGGSTSRASNGSRCRRSRPYATFAGSWPCRTRRRRTSESRI